MTPPTPQLKQRVVQEECGPLTNEHFSTYWFSIPSIRGTVVSLSPKRLYKDRVMKVENGTFTPPVFSSAGEMAQECKIFIKQMSSLVDDHRKNTYSLVVSWIKTKLSFTLLPSAMLCIGGTCNPYYKNVVAYINNIVLECHSTKINND